MDVLEGKDLYYNVHNCGHVELMDCMPRLIPHEAVENGLYADYAIPQMARISYSHGTKKVNTDVGLIKYLMRHRHTSPFEGVTLKFRIKAPIFVIRQWFRHRTASINEISGRYSVLKNEFYFPDTLFEQNMNNRQGSGEEIKNTEIKELFDEYLSTSHSSYTFYDKLIEKGVAREEARIGLPLTLMSEFYWVINLHNLYHFLSLRMDVHSQQEIRDYADVIFKIISPICPISSEAFLNYNLNSITLTALEIDAIKSKSELNTENKREKTEFEQKKQLLGLINE